jgi:16S rRNA (cytosine1402-N4)-methyltransferase
MTYGNPDEGVTASDLVNSLKEEELADLIYTYGEERFSRGIAKSIVEMRKHTKITTTAQLALAVEQGTPSWYHHRKLHPATKTFQALRIATNDELGARSLSRYRGYRLFRYENGTRQAHQED